MYRLILVSSATFHPRFTTLCSVTSIESPALACFDTLSRYFEVANSLAEQLVLLIVQNMLEKERCQLGEDSSSDRNQNTRLLQWRIVPRLASTLR